MSKEEGPFIGITRVLAKLPAPSDPLEAAALRSKCRRAGFRHEEYRLFSAGPKIVLAVLFAAASFLILDKGAQGKGSLLMLYVAAAAVFGGYVPGLLLYWKIKQRQRNVFEEFPDAADLLLICVEAGLGLDSALETVTRESRKSSAVIAEELYLCRLELRAGASLEQSLKNLALRTGVEEVSSFATMLTQADTLGVSIGDSLRLFSDDLRHQRLTRAEELAARVPTKMLFPLVLFIFPSSFLVLLGPGIIHIIRTLGAMVAES